MKKLTIIISVFIIVFILLFIVNPKKEFSDNENRYLATLPEFSFENLFSGTYINDLENYITDHFPFRDYFVGIKSDYELLLQKKEINEVYIGEDEYLFEKYNTPERIEELVNTLNNFTGENNEKSVNYMFIPSSGYIYDELLPNNVNYENQKETIEYLNINLDNNIDVTKTFLDNKEKYNLYFRLDHHYTINGAYLAYSEYAKSKNLNIVDLEVDCLSDEFNGSLYSKTNIYSYKADEFCVYHTKTVTEVNYIYENKKTNSIYDELHLDLKDKYSYYLGGNFPLIEINTNIENGKEILIIKDSYANSLIPFLTNHYSKIHVIDLRFYKNNITNYMENTNIKEVLILYSVTNLNSDYSLYSLK